VSAAAAAINVLGFAGSLRRGSYNAALLRTAQELAPADLRIRVVTLESLPYYHADVEAAGDPPAVAAFKAEVAAADAVLIATPEYNDGIPGVLATAIDWASRFPGRHPLLRKPVALMGASPSQVGTARAQAHLRQVLHHVDARVLPPPEVLVAKCHEKFDDALRLSDEATRRLLHHHLERLGWWVRRERAAAAVLP
jgi:chromate reductase